MNLRLINYDIDNFLNKYTRFMTKDIYISLSLYNNFLKQYEYLYDIVKKENEIYDNNKKYKKVIDIFDKGKKLIRLHNQKYLSRAIKGDMYNKLSFDNRRKMIVLTEEENTYVVEPKNYVSLIVEKINYLINYKKYKENSILVIVKNKKDSLDILNKCNYNINIVNITEYINQLLGNKKMTDNNTKYTFFINYIMNDLFSNKEKFNNFYDTFSKYIYLNKDYLDFDTFKDYHNYMYKRKYLASGLTLKKFNESEIKKRKNYLRTINNEVVFLKEEVDIANFLTLNSIGYIYDSKDNSFKLTDRDIIIKYINKIKEENTYKDNTIYLNSNGKENKTYLEVLAYELIKIRYPLELASDKDIYTKLKNTNIDNYFNEFINKYLIPLTNYYEEYHNLDNLNISKPIKEEFLKLYEIYINYLHEHNIITKKELFIKMEHDLNNNCYKYLFLVGVLPIECNIKTFTVVPDYPENELIKDNIKLLYDHKKYLYNHQLIPIIHTFTSIKEITKITQEFLKDNLLIINKKLEDNNKTIKIYEYDDSNRLKVYSNISSRCTKILQEYSKNTLLAFKQIKDINILINNNFTKLNKNTLTTENNIKLEAEEILKINKIYDNIILPYLIKDNYHDELFINENYNTKVMLYIALNKCRHNLIILCPTSKVNDFTKIFEKLRVQLIKDKK